MSGRSPQDRSLGIVAYGVLAGILATTMGAWASSPFTGGVRIPAWIGATAVLSLVLAWFAEAVVAILGRWFLHGLSGRSLPGLGRHSIFR
jgi:hypothetical protein